MGGEGRGGRRFEGVEVISPPFQLKTAAGDRCKLLSLSFPPWILLVIIQKAEN